MKTAFDRWLAQEYRRTKGFTALTFLVTIGERAVEPLASTYFHVIGDDTSWGALTGLLAGSGHDWDGVAFFPRALAGGGPISDTAARVELSALARRLGEDRMVLNEGEFFDAWGRRLRIDEIGTA